MEPAPPRKPRPPASLALEGLGIPHRVFAHPGRVTSLAQAAAERDQLPGQVVRSLLFRLEQGEYVLVLAAGSGQLDWKALRTYLGRSRISMARPEEVVAVTGYAVGTVAPVGLRSRLRILVDASVLIHQELSIGSGVAGTALVLDRDDLLRALGGHDLVDLSPGRDPSGATDNQAQSERGPNGGSG